MKFEILCLDNAEKVKSQTTKALLYALLANDTFFKAPQMNETTGEITDSESGLLVHVAQYPTDKMLTGARYSVAFTITVSCDKMDIIDNFRLEIVDYIKVIGFSNVRILQDEVSAKLAETLYPRIYLLENQVRSFIINFFLKNLGTNWTKLAIPSETLDKIKKRKTNDRIFIASDRIDSDVSLIDFDDLGRILYNENSILSSKKADNVTLLIQKISQATDLDSLKSDVLEGNFYKYFKDCFTQKDFQTKWYNLYYYRNKLAHNGSFSQDEVNACHTLCDEILGIIEAAYKKLDTFKLSTSDQEALMSAVNDFAADTQQSENPCENKFAAITEETLLKELRDAQQRLPFVGLRHFVVEILGSKGFDYDSSFTLINYLADKKVINLTKVANPNGSYPTTGISVQ